VQVLGRALRPQRDPQEDHEDPLLDPVQHEAFAELFAFMSSNTPNLLERLHPTSGGARGSSRRGSHGISFTQTAAAAAGRDSQSSSSSSSSSDSEDSSSSEGEVTTSSRPPIFRAFGERERERERGRGGKAQPTAPRPVLPPSVPQNAREEREVTEGVFFDYLTERFPPRFPGDEEILALMERGGTVGTGVYGSPPNALDPTDVQFHRDTETEDERRERMSAHRHAPILITVGDERELTLLLWMVHRSPGPLNGLPDEVVRHTASFLYGGKREPEPGDLLEVLDTVRKWYPALVVQKRGEEVFVHYYRWGHNYDEWLPLTSRRIELPFTRPGPYGRVSRTHPTCAWCSQMHKKCFGRRYSPVL